MLTQCLFLKSLICNTSVTSLPIETTTKVISPPGSPLASPASDRTGNLNSPAHSQCTSPEFSSKASLVETVIKKISSHLNYSNTVSNCVMKYLKKQLKESKRGTNFYESFYCLKPSEKEKQSCLCINCLNSHVILKSINCYRLTKKLTPHDSLTTYFNKMSSGKTLEEMKIEKECKYYEYRRVVESYIGKNGKRIECTRSARVDLSEPFFKLVEKLRELGDNYLKHRTNVNNISSVFPILKEHYDGKYIELDFSQNLSLKPKMNSNLPTSVASSSLYIAQLQNQPRTAITFIKVTIPNMIPCLLIMWSGT